MSIVDEMTPDKITFVPIVPGWFKYETGEAFYYLCQILAKKGNRFRPITLEEVSASIGEVFFPNMNKDAPFHLTRIYQAIEYYWDEISWYAEDPIRAASLDGKIAIALLP